MATQSPAKKPGRLSYTAPPEKRSRTRLLIGIVVGIIVIALAAAVIASRGGESDVSQTASVEVNGAALPPMQDGA